MGLKATEVFTPGFFPTHTYVARKDTNLEQSLRDALDTAGQIVSLAGPPAQRVQRSHSSCHRTGLPRYGVRDGVVVRAHIHRERSRDR